MKKIFVLSFIMTFVLICCSGCDGDVTRSIRHDGFSIGNDFVCDIFFPKKKDDTSYEKIKYLTDTHIITDKGKIYEISLSQPYANNANCKVADTDIEVDSIFDNKIIKAVDGKLYYLTPDNQTAAYSEVSAEDNSFYIYDLLLNPAGTVKVLTADSSSGLYYVLKDDGNVYGYTVSQNDRNAPPSITSTSIIYNKNDYDSKIVDFNYAGESSATFAKTENSAYKMYMENEEECSKYVDVQCKYKMKEFESYREYKDYFLAYNGKTIITKYGKTFSAVK